MKTSRPKGLLHRPIRKCYSAPLTGIAHYVFHDVLEEDHDNKINDNKIDDKKIDDKSTTAEIDAYYTAYAIIGTTLAISYYVLKYV